MTPFGRQVPDVATGEAVIETLLQTALWLFDLTTSLLEDLPEDAFPGEGSGAVLIEMLTGSCSEAIAAAGDDVCKGMVELAVAIRENVRADPMAAAKLARQKEVLL